jgi:hypothetical protein
VLASLAVQGGVVGRLAPGIAEGTS